MRQSDDFIQSIVIKYIEHHIFCDKNTFWDEKLSFVKRETQFHGKKVLPMGTKHLKAKSSSLREKKWKKRRKLLKLRCVRKLPPFLPKNTWISVHTWRNANNGDIENGNENTVPAIALAQSSRRYIYLFQWVPIFLLRHCQCFNIHSLLNSTSQSIWENVEFFPLARSHSAL